MTGVRQAGAVPGAARKTGTREHRRSRVSPIAARVALGLVAGWVLAGCAVGPDYARPVLETPDTFRGAEGVPSGGGSAEDSLADLGWWEVFEDLQLRGYVEDALVGNWDLQVAAARVLQAEAAARVARSAFFPTVTAGGDVVTTRTSERGPFGVPGMDPEREYGGVFASLSAYEVDVWGRLRRANEAARARLLATENVQQTVRQTLVAQVATAYFELLELDAALEVGQRTLVARQSSLALTQAREEGGVASLQDVAQARILVATAEASIVNTRRRLEQKENELCLLLGQYPGSISLGAPLEQQPVRAEVPAGLPSSLLERRPDVRVAEQALVAANAEVGEAKAAFFPVIQLTGLYGFQSVSLGSLFTAPAQVWQFGPSVTFPVFTGGRLRGNLQEARARFEEALAGYQQTVQNAFREVSDGLIEYQKTREFRARMEEQTTAHREAAALATVRYEGGVTSYLEVLYNEQELFDAELQLTQARLRELLSVVRLYRALGGGWQVRRNDGE